MDSGITRQAAEAFVNSVRLGTLYIQDRAWAMKCAENKCGRDEIVASVREFIAGQAAYG